MHYYLWLRIVRDTGIGEPWRAIASGGLVLLGVMMLAGFPLMRFAPRRLTSPVMWVAYTWMGLAFFTIVLLGMGELIKLCARLASLASGFDVERRRYLARWIAAAAAGGAAGLSAWGGRGATAGAGVAQRRAHPLARPPPTLLCYPSQPNTPLQPRPPHRQAFSPPNRPTRDNPRTH